MFLIHKVDASDTLQMVSFTVRNHKTFVSQDWGGSSLPDPLQRWKDKIGQWKPFRIYSNSQYEYSNMNYSIPSHSYVKHTNLLKYHLNCFEVSVLLSDNVSQCEKVPVIVRKSVSLWEGVSHCGKDVSHFGKDVSLLEGVSLW